MTLEWHEHLMVISYASKLENIPSRISAMSDWKSKHWGDLSEQKGSYLTFNHSSKINTWILPWHWCNHACYVHLECTRAFYWCRITLLWYIMCGDSLTPIKMSEQLYEVLGWDGTNGKQPWPFLRTVRVMVKYIILYNLMSGWWSAVLWWF